MRTASTALVAGKLVEALARSWRVEVVGEERVRDLRRSAKPVVFAVWHANMLPPLWHRRGEGITLLVSSHGDGGYLANAAQRWGYRVVRGSSTRLGVGGLRAIVRVLAEGGDVAFTPDGPRGPAGRAKPGALAAARLGKAAIVPVGASASSAWRFRSWDGFTLPQPFARVRLVYGAHLAPEDAERPDARLIRTLEARLDSTQSEAVWR